MARIRLTPEEAESRRVTRSRANALAYAQRVRSWTRLEQEAYRLRAQLGDGDPYTPRERAEAEAIRADAARLQARAAALNRLQGKALGRARDSSVLLAPF